MSYPYLNYPEYKCYTCGTAITPGAYNGQCPACIQTRRLTEAIEKAREPEQPVNNQPENQENSSDDKAIAIAVLAVIAFVLYLLRDTIVVKLIVFFIVVGWGILKILFQTVFQFIGIFW